MERYEPGAPPEEAVRAAQRDRSWCRWRRVELANEEIAATACRIALEQGGRIVGVTAIPIPMRDPLYEPAPEAEADAAAAQAMALRLAPDYGIEYLPVVQRTRNPGRTIVDVAGRIRRRPDRGRLAGQEARLPGRARRRSSGARSTSSCERRPAA